MISKGFMSFGKSLEKLLWPAKKGNILPKGSVDAGSAIVDMSWVEDQIMKMQMLCKQVRVKQELPLKTLEGRALLNYLYPGRMANECPVCHHKFNKQLQRATYCPECNGYLRVKYGHLLSDKECERIGEIQQLDSMLWRYEQVEPDQIRMLARCGMDDTIREIIVEFSNKIEPYL